MPMLHQKWCLWMGILNRCKIYAQRLNTYSLCHVRITVYFFMIYYYTLLFQRNYVRKKINGSSLAQSRCLHIHHLRSSSFQNGTLKPNLWNKILFWFISVEKIEQERPPRHCEFGPKSEATMLIYNVVDVEWRNAREKWKVASWKIINSHYPRCIEEYLVHKDVAKQISSRKLYIYTDIYGK